MVTNTGSIKGFIKKFQAHPAWHFFLIVFIARTVQLGQLYFFKTPSGGAFVERAALGFFCALIADFAAIAILTSIFALSTLAKGRLRTVFCSATAVITWVYLAACASNDQILRWMGQHLTFSFLSTYSVSRMDSTLAFNVIYDGLFSFGLNFGEKPPHHMLDDDIFFRFPPVSSPHFRTDTFTPKLSPMMPPTSRPTPAVADHPRSFGDSGV